MESRTPYVDALSASLPSILSDNLLSFDTHSLETLETLVRFSAGGACPPRIADHASAWDSAQTRLRERLSKLEPGIGTKRARESDDDGANTPVANGHAIAQKKPKFTAEEAAPGEDAKTLYTLHALSVTAPVRKKVDIVLTPDAIRLTNPATAALEARIPLAQLTRAFLTSSLGKNKNKPQWAITLLSADSVGKKGTGDAVDQVQFAFAVDKTVPGGKDGFRTTIGNGALAVSHAKGTETLALLQAFLAQLAPHIEVQTALGNDGPVGAFASSAGEPYVEAYRGAKEGALAFLPRGILWAGTRPAEFFALEDLALDADGEDASRGGVKTLSATGRTFSVFVRRRLPHAESSDDDEEDEDEYEETEFAMIDGRESENVNTWIRRYRKQFGKPRMAPGTNGSSAATQADIKGKGKAEAEPQEAVAVDEDESDASDEDYASPSDSDGGEPSSDSEEEEQGDGAEDDEAEAEESDQEGFDDEVEELDPAHHPLMRPGAMPRMSKAALDAVVQMAMNDMVGSAEEEEEDELE